MDDDVASESTWLPVHGSDRMLSGSEGDFREPLISSGSPLSGAGGMPYHAAYERPRRRSSVQDVYQPIRTPFRTRLERMGRILTLVNQVLLPIGFLLLAGGASCSWFASNVCGGIAAWLLESGGTVAGLAILLDVLYLACLAPYAIFMNQSNRDPLSCGPKRYIFPNHSAVPGVLGVLALLASSVVVFGLACPLVDEAMCRQRLRPWLVSVGSAAAVVCVYALICLLYGDKGGIATLWIMSVVAGSVGGACLADQLVGVVECHNALGWSLTAAGWTLAYAIPLGLASLWSRKCWPFVLAGGFMVFGAVVGGTGAACLTDVLVGVSACQPAAGWALAITGIATGGLPFLVIVFTFFYYFPYLIGEHAAVISVHQFPLNTNWLGIVGIITFCSVITASLSAMCWRETIFADTYCGEDADGEWRTPALYIMVFGFPTFLATMLLYCCVCWKGWMNKSSVDSWVH